MSNTEKEEEPVARQIHWVTLSILHSEMAGLAARRTLIVRDERAILGRSVSGGGDVLLREDPRVSERHADLRIVGRGAEGPPNVMLRDLGSTNGTFVNGQSVTQKECALQDGDVIRVGSTFLVVRIETAVAHDKLTPLIPGTSPAMRIARRLIQLVAPTSAPVLILGETGVGKELVARTLHQASDRKGAFVAVNCAAIPGELAESALFGHVRGAFSGAHQEHTGYFRAADGGTLFLDEIGEMPLGLQPKLLRALEDGAIYPTGSTRLVPFNTRVIAATNRELGEEKSAVAFRADLYARLAMHIIRVPPLCERKEDILPLLYEELGAGTPPLSTRLVEALLRHSWPYNVRELKQIAACLRLHAQDGVRLDLPLIAERLSRSAPPPTQQDTTVSLSSPSQPPSRDALVRLLTEHGGIVARVAAALGRSHRHIRRLLEQHRLDAQSFKQGARRNP